MKKEYMEPALPVSGATIESATRVMTGLKNGAYREHLLSNAAVPFSEKESNYLAAFVRMMNSLNFNYIIDCTGATDEVYCK